MLTVGSNTCSAIFTTRVPPIPMNLKKRLLIVGIAVTLTIVFLHRSASSLDPGWLPEEVEGWTGNTSRDFKDYINKPHILPTNFCVEKSFLLVMVNTKPENFEARDVIRSTWGQKHDNVTFYFLIGEVLDKSVQEKLKNESTAHNDIIQERFIDAYNNLTLKSINMLKLYNLHCSKSYKYLLKIDDDVFLNVNNLLQALTQSSSTDFLMGHLISDTKPFRDPTNKWFVPYSFYPDDKYPDYICGPVYIMSNDVADKLYRCALETPIFHIEDVYITGICAKKMNVVPQHDSNVSCYQNNNYICLHRDAYSLHHYNLKEMRKSFRIVQEDSCPPAGSFKEFVFSLLF